MKVVGMLLSIQSGMWGAYVISKLWLWFVVPVGVIPVTWTHAWGLWLLSGMFTTGVALTVIMHCSTPDSEVAFPPKTRLIASAISMAFVYLLMLTTGALVHHFGMPH